ncbi:MerR family transcriptional regulator [Bacillus aquiflavi]|uniref:MerR family transcriptional regulator n=1 Tax=Bacillus aquiflavi TaxID=2672567 RepID=A0A6B3VVU9_9BACI|nr:MerR family transcriptional regulator [Bacillus aquiflavi]MBA4537061.1 MerR family transcriptional regulator [Bacillus aquiflavi]NEY81358.1 MerR family transcriptional regulator [Bacillus aquiflavi]
MYSIGQFSKKTGVTVRTLRYYDEKDLLKPSYISETGRRYYKDDDIITLQKITGLKALGYSLKDVHLLIRQPQWGITESLRYQKEKLLQKVTDIKKNIELLDQALSLAQANKVVEPAIFIALIQNSLQWNLRKQWLKTYLPNQIVDEIYDGSNSNKNHYDIMKRLKVAYKQQYTDDKVYNILEELFSQVPRELFKRLLTDPKLLEIQLDEMLFPSPFSKEEEQWLSEKIENMLKEDKIK